MHLSSINIKFLPILCLPFNSYIFSFWVGISSQTLSKIHVDPHTGHYMDEVGRIRMFRGINAVNKRPPYYFDIMLNETIVKKLAGLGMNIIRLGNMWDGWQPTGPDSFDDTYEKMLEVVGFIKNLHSIIFFTIIVNLNQLFFS